MKKKLFSLCLKVKVGVGVGYNVERKKSSVLSGFYVSAWNSYNNH